MCVCVRVCVCVHTVHVCVVNIAALWSECIDLYNLKYSYQEELDTTLQWSCTLNNVVQKIFVIAKLKIICHHTKSVQITVSVTENTRSCRL